MNRFSWRILEFGMEERLKEAWALLRDSVIPFSNKFQLVPKRLENHQGEVWGPESWVNHTKSPSRFLDLIPHPGSSLPLHILDYGTRKAGARSQEQVTGLKTCHILCALPALSAQGLGWAPSPGCVSSHSMEPFVYVGLWGLAHLLITVSSTWWV